jgi:hypothetical protein
MVAVSATAIGWGRGVVNSRLTAGHLACAHTFVASDGRPYARFRRALLTKHPGIILPAGAELPGLLDPPSAHLRLCHGWFRCEAAVACQHMGRALLAPAGNGPVKQPPTPPRLRWRDVARAALALAIPVVVLSAVVGCVGSKEGFDWTLASVFGTALGTTLLAAAAGALAWSTYAWELANREDGERPVIVVKAVTYSPGRIPGGRLPPLASSLSDGHIDIELANVGAGPALDIATTAEYVGAERDPDTRTASVAAWDHEAKLKQVFPGGHPTLGPSETSRCAKPVEVVFTIDPPGGLMPSGDDFRVSGNCYDRHGGSHAVITPWSLGRHYGEPPEQNH